jgi:DNA-directed RNA polymerase sigma subunit (sigma70/sigma32)
LRNYATKAIHREEFARGPLPDHADIIQQIYVEWREGVGTAENVHAQVLERDSAERVAFRGAVRRVLDRARYDAVKQRRRADMTPDDTAASASTGDWADLEIDLAQGIGKLTERERDILSFRRWGMTFEEIGEKLGMSRQRVFEAYAGLLDRLSAIYQD